MTTENTLPFDYFLSSQMEKIRDDMFEGKKIDGCEGCYIDEEINGHSHRTKFNEGFFCVIICAASIATT